MPRWSGLLTDFLGSLKFALPSVEDATEGSYCFCGESPVTAFGLMTSESPRTVLGHVLPIAARPKRPQHLR